MEPQLFDSTPEKELIYAITSNQNDRVNYYLSQGISPDSLDHQNGLNYVLISPALCCGIENNNLDAVNLLIKAGANVNAADNNGYTPLILVIESRTINNENKLALIKQLVEAKADINKPGFYDQTPLMYAAGNLFWSDAKDILFTLIEYGAEIATKNHDYCTVIDILKKNNEHDLANQVLAAYENRRLNDIIRNNHSIATENTLF